MSVGAFASCGHSANWLRLMQDALRTPAWGHQNASQTVGDQVDEMYRGSLYSRGYLMISKVIGL